MEEGLNAQANASVLHRVSNGKPLTIFEQEKAVIKDAFERLFWKQQSLVDQRGWRVEGRGQGKKILQQFR